MQPNGSKTSENTSRGFSQREWLALASEGIGLTAGPDQGPNSRIELRKLACGPVLPRQARSPSLMVGWARRGRIDLTRETDDPHSGRAVEMMICGISPRVLLTQEGVS